MAQNRNKPNEVNYLVLKKALITGLVGGVFGSLVWSFMHFFQLIEIRPFIIWEKLLLDDVAFKHWYMYIIGLGLNGAVSIIIAAFYFLLLKQLNHWITGVLYGIIIWAITYIFFPMMLFDYNPLKEASLEAHTGFLCFMILYGVFIGYTISFDYETLHEELDNN